MKKIETCNKCSDLGHSTPNGPHLQLGKGLGKKVLVIAESPAKNGWRVSGRAFYTTDGKILATGRRLDDYLKRYNLGVSEISFTELVKCYLSDRKLLEKSGHNCFEYLKEQINELKPSLVITLGVIPNKVLSAEYGTDLPIGTISDVDGFKYLPLYHPSPASPYGHKKNLDILEKLDKEIEQIINP